MRPLLLIALAGLVACGGDDVLPKDRKSVV